MKKKYGFKGKYCTICHSVWEVTTTTGEAGKLVKHPEFPSYGLEREYCATCKQTSPEENTPSTLAQKLVTKHQKLFTTHVKKQNK